MNLKKKLRDFFTLTRKADGGFTLVELIVVIAILAILAGVGVPAYTGYIEKANEAADQQLLADLNTAFAAACLANGENNYGRTDDPSVTITDGVVDVDALTTGSEKVNDAFKTFFEGGTFKVTTELYYNGQLGGFFVNKLLQFMYGGVTINVPKEYIDLIANSTFLQQGSLGGTNGLLDKIADVSDFAALIIGGSGNASNLLNGVIGSQEFNAFAAKALGIDPSDTAAFAAKDAELIAAMKAKDPSITTDTEARNKYMTNAAVLFAANNATNMSKEDIMASLTNQNVKQNIIDTMATNTTTAFSQATLAYGMYTAWAHASGNTEAQQKDELDVMNDLNNTQFQAWLSSPQGQADLDAYLAALKVVNSSSQDPGSVSNVVVNGFGDSELKDAVSGLFGNN